jgi:hypothetical protein
MWNTLAISASVTYGDRRLYEIWQKRSIALGCKRVRRLGCCETASISSLHEALSVPSVALKRHLGRCSASLIWDSMQISAIACVAHARHLGRGLSLFPLFSHPYIPVTQCMCFLQYHDLIRLTVDHRETHGQPWADV